MSELSVGQLKGLTVNNNTITVPSGHTIYVPGQIVNAQSYTNSNRLAWGSVSSVTLWSGISFTKKFAETKLYVYGMMNIRGGWEYGTNFAINISGTTYNGIGGYTNTDSTGTSQASWPNHANLSFEQSGIPSGNLSISLIKNNINSSTMAPAVLNPTSSDDGRYFSSTRSTLIIMEIAQ